MIFTYFIQDNKELENIIYLFYRKYCPNDGHIGIMQK